MNTQTWPHICEHAWTRYSINGIIYVLLWIVEEQARRYIYTTLGWTELNWTRAFCPTQFLRPSVTKCTRGPLSHRGFWKAKPLQWMENGKRKYLIKLHSCSTGRLTQTFRFVTHARRWSSAREYGTNKHSKNSHLLWDLFSVWSEYDRTRRSSLHSLSSSSIIHLSKKAAHEYLR